VQGESRLRQAPREALHARRPADRQERQVLDPARHVARSVRAVPQPLGHLRREVQDERAVGGGEAMEGVAIQAEQHAVANGAHARGARAAGEQADLAEALAAPELAEEPSRSRVATLPDLQSPARDQEEGVGRISLPEEPVASANLEDAELREQGVRRPGIVNLEEALDGAPQATRRAVLPGCGFHRPWPLWPAWLAVGLIVLRAEPPRSTHPRRGRSTRWRGYR
jgi:hypothetical protein